MSNYKSTIASFFLILSLIISPLPFATAASNTYDLEEQTSPMTMTADLLLCRPLGMVAMLGGTLIFVVSSPFSFFGGNIEEAWGSLVVTPAEYTFKRPLGEFE